MQRILPYFALATSFLLWGGFYFFVNEIYRERAEYLLVASQLQENAVLGESAARLHAAVVGTALERTALEKIVNVPVIEVANIVEAAGKQAGLSSVAIGDASPIGAPKGMTGLSVVVQGSGSFGSVARAIGIFETLPIPATLQHFEMEKIESSWKLNAQLNALVSPQQ